MNQGDYLAEQELIEAVGKLKNKKSSWSDCANSEICGNIFLIKISTFIYVWDAKECLRL